MLLEEYTRLAKSLHFVSPEQSKEIIRAIADRLKRETRGTIVGIWALNPGRAGIDILSPYLWVADDSVPTPHPIALAIEATGPLMGGRAKTAALA